MTLERNKHLLAIAIGAGIALAAPAAASADSTLSVQGDRIVFTGDSAGNALYVDPKQGGEQFFQIDATTQVGSGCRRVAADDPNQPPGPLLRDARGACSLGGVTAFQMDAGDGGDVAYFNTTTAMDLPTFVDMGPGGDHWDFGSSATDTVTTGEGNDTLYNGLGADVLRGGAGDDSFEFGVDDSEDQLYGDDGNDVLNGFGGADRVDGGAGDDTLFASSGNDTQIGGDGNDLLQGGPEENVLEGGAGDDTITGDAGVDEIFGGDGADTVSGDFGRDRILGGQGNDRLNGGDDGDLIGVVRADRSCEEPGDDELVGGPGDDELCGGEGLDALSGDAGDDVMNVLDGTSDKSIECGAGSDLLSLDPVDPVALDCEGRALAARAKLARSGVLPVPNPCRPSGCRGTLTLALSTRAATPLADELPLPLRTAQTVLARDALRLKRGASTVKVRLAARALKQLRKRRLTSVEARMQTTAGGRRTTLRQTFPVTTR